MGSHIGFNGCQDTLNFTSVPCVWYNERRKVIPEVIVPIPRPDGVCPNLAEEFVLGLANVVGFVIPE